ncbi:hypothetical protein RRG08_052053 [Elysia crispata]|uniref:Uncharacterized protein n=1 Tax=Elysia crispata TaxID=231223 RepID=A0AAE1A5L4_9GAST|nr:hypothetical protein RRG08_052053 [Elysia crispata]
MWTFSALITVTVEDQQTEDISKSQKLWEQSCQGSCSKKIKLLLWRFELRPQMVLLLGISSTDLTHSANPSSELDNLVHFYIKKRKLSGFSVKGRGSSWSELYGCQVVTNLLGNSTFPSHDYGGRSLACVEVSSGRPVVVWLGDRTSIPWAFLSGLEHASHVVSMLSGEWLNYLSDVDTGYILSFTIPSDVDNGYPQLTYPSDVDIGYILSFTNPSDVDNGYPQLTYPSDVDNGYILSSLTLVMWITDILSSLTLVMWITDIPSSLTLVAWIPDIPSALLTLVAWIPDIFSAL